MPQLSLYIDEKTLRRLEAVAKLEHLSISKYVVTKLNESFKDRWPGNYNELFGSITDETFDISRRKDFGNDAERENL